MPSKFEWLLWLAGSVLSGLSLPALGATSISPVIIDVPSDGRATVTVRNDGARAVLYQVTVVDWHVMNGADQHGPTQDFIASPPLFLLAPKASQVVRMGFRSPTRQPLEKAYRLVLAEVPQPGAAPAAGGEVNFALQYLLPVFVAPSSRGAKPPLVWSMHTEGNAIAVRAYNPGTSRTALNMVGLSTQPSADAAPEWANHQRVTVLAQSWREWRFSVPSDPKRLPWSVVFLNDGTAAAVVVPSTQIRLVTAH